MLVWGRKEKSLSFGARKRIGSPIGIPIPQSKVYSFFGDLAFAPAFDFVGVAGYSLEWEELVSSSFPLRGGFVFRRGEGGTPAVP